MSQPLEPGLVLPKPQTARVFGILNIVFAGMTFFYIYFSALMFLFAPVGASLVRAWMGNLQRQMTRQVDSQVQTLERLRDAATDPIKRADFDTRLAQLKANPRPNLTQMAAGMEQLENPTIRTYSLVGFLVSVPLTAVGLISGFGLLSLREWGRKLAVGISGINLGYLVVSMVIAIIVVFPIQSRLAMKQIEAQQKFQASLMRGGGPPPGPTAQQMGGMMAISTTLSGLFGFALAATYPVISIWMLSRPAVKAACRPTDHGDDAPGGWTS